MIASFERSRHRHRHLLLLDAELKVFRAGKDAVGREDFGDLFDEVGFAATGIEFDRTDHADPFRRATISICALFLAIIPFARIPRQLTFGYTAEPRPMIVPGLRTALQ